MRPANQSRSRRVVRVLTIGAAMAALSLMGLVVAGVLLVKQVASRVTIDPAAMSAFFQEAVVIAIREGTPEEKIALVKSFETVPPADAAPYLPLIEEAAMDEDADVSLAARTILQRLAPAALPARQP